MLTLAELLREVETRLNERLCVEHPPPYGEGIIVDFDKDEGGVLVVQPQGPSFVVLVEALP